MPKKGAGTFSYPGGKTTIAPWIIDHFPAHECYVEPFGGSASVLAQKPKSDVEVFNDLQDDIVHFFRTLREERDDLIEWLKATPYARAQFEEWRDQFADGHRPADDVERAGRFFTLIQQSYGGKLRSPSFKTHKSKDSAQSFPESFANSKRSLRELATRFETAIIENQDYRDVIDRYDGEDTLFYCDPPYLTDTAHYLADEFDHEEFVAVLDDVEGRWIVSYDELPAGLDGYHCVTRSRKWVISQDQTSEGTEKLIMNFDPENTPKFVEQAQKTLTGVDP